METLTNSGKRVTLILNIPPHYREPIFRLIESGWSCRWIFGENKTDIPSCPTDFMDNVICLPIKRGRFNTWWLKGLTNVLHTEKQDAIILTGEIKFLSSWRVMLWNTLKPKSKRARVFLWSHGWDGTEKGLRRLFYRFYFGLADGLLLYGNRSAQIAIKEGIAPEKIAVIHNSLDHDRFLGLRRKVAETNAKTFFDRYFSKPELPTLVYIGRLSLVKKISQIIEAVALLRKRGCEVNVLVIGDGPDRNLLHLMAEESGLSDNVHFCGAEYNIDTTAPAVYHAAICVSPGHIGLTAIHSLELGTPVVTHSDMTCHAPEIEAITDGETGQLFEKDNIKDLAKAISRQLDQNRLLGRDAVRNSCYRAVESWTPEWQINAFRKAID